MTIREHDLVVLKADIPAEVSKFPTLTPFGAPAVFPRT
jgi:hypothetical protein